MGVPHKTRRVEGRIPSPGHSQTRQTSSQPPERGTTYRNDRGEIVRASLNAVSVTPLEPLLAGSDKTFVDRIYSIQRIRP